jgi:hypothetical protein
VQLLERRHDGQHRFNKAGSLGTVSPKAPLAPEDARPYSSLRRVVRGLHPLMAHARPQRLAQLQDFPAGAFGLGDTTGLAHLQPPLHLPPAGLPVGPEAGLSSQGLSDLSRAPTPRDQRFDSAQQLCSTELPAPGGVPGVPPPALRHQPPPEVLAQGLPGDLATPRAPHHKDRDQGGTTVHSQARCRPSRHPVSSAYAAGWVCTEARASATTSATAWVVACSRCAMVPSRSSTPKQSSSRSCRVRFDR